MEEPINIGTGTDIAIAEPIGFEGRFVFDPAKLDGNPRKLLKVSIQCYNTDRLCQYKKSDPERTHRSRSTRWRQTCNAFLGPDLDKLVKRRSADCVRPCGYHAAPIDRRHDRERPLAHLTPKVLAGTVPSAHETPPRGPQYLDTKP